MSFFNMSYSIRGRNKQSRINRWYFVLVIMVSLFFLYNGEYISYLSSKENYTHVKAKILEWRMTGRFPMLIVEYKDINGKNQKVWVDVCFLSGDDIGEEIVLAISKDKKALRIHPTYKGKLWTFGVLFTGFGMTIIQFTKRPRKKNAVDAQVVEKKQKICDGKLKEYVICRYTDEKGNEYTYQSEMVPYRINLKVGDMVEVAVDPYDLNSYFVQLDGSAVSYRRL